MYTNDEHLVWQETEQKVLYQTPIMDITQTHSISPENKSGNYIVLETKNWIMTVPVLEKDGKKHFVLVRQWRHGSKSLSTEFPGGIINENEEPEAGAARELLEETGYSAQKLTHLGTVSPNPAIMRNQIHFYAAENLVNTGLQNLDKDEFINCIIEPVEETFKKMGHGQYTHALTSTALLLYLQKYAKNISF